MSAPAAGSDPPDSRQRERIEDYAIIGTAREARFDRLVFTAAQFFRVPIALITLIDHERIWFKARAGLDLQECSRHVALCERLLPSNNVIVVEDASRDERLLDNSFVTGPPFIRLYAGAPLITPDGVRVGSFCIADHVAKSLSTRQSWQLGQFASSAVALLEARRNRT